MSGGCVPGNKNDDATCNVDRPESDQNSVDCGTDRCVAKRERLQKAGKCVKNACDGALRRCSGCRHNSVPVCP